MRLVPALLAALALAVALAVPARASEQHPTLAELETEVMCVECHTTLDMSDSPFAARMRVHIRQMIAAGDTKSEIKRKLVAQFGEGVLAQPPRRGFGLLAWVLPIGGIVLAAGALGFGAWKWSRSRQDGDVDDVDGGVHLRHEPPEPLEPELERRLDEELLRFDG